MEIGKGFGSPYDATNSWNGYNHQGKIALWYAIRTIIELWDDLDPEQSRKSMKEYFLELEYEEDFSIGKYSQKGNVYLSIHQVKARTAPSIDAYKDAILALLIKTMKRNTINKACLHVSQDVQISREKFLQAVDAFSQSPKEFEVEITAKRNDPEFRKTFYVRRSGRPLNIKAAVQSALREKYGDRIDLTEKNLDQAFDAYLEAVENLPKASQAEKEKICLFEYPDLPNTGDKQQYCGLSQTAILLTNIIKGYYEKTDPTGWKKGDPAYLQKMYLHLLGNLDQHVIQRHLKRSDYLLGKLDRTIPLVKIMSWLDEDIDDLGENYYLYYIKEELFKALNEYCHDCAKRIDQCVKCHIEDAKEKIGTMPYDEFREFIYIVTPHKSGRINMSSYASFADRGGLQNPFSKGLRDISVPFSLRDTTVPITYYDSARKQYVLTTIQMPETDGGKAGVCKTIVDNPNIFDLLMDCDVLISKDICSDSIWADAQRLTDVVQDPKQAEHIAHCKDVKIMLLDSCQDSFVTEEEGI